MSDHLATEPVDILLVEDNPGDARLIEEAFKAADFSVKLHVVTDGDDALRFLADQHESTAHSYPDLVLLDLNLPRTDGFTVLEEIRRDDPSRLLPVIVLTSSHATEDIVKSYELSANAYLTKPTSHDDFVRLVQSVEEFWFETAHLPPITTE